MGASSRTRSGADWGRGLATTAARCGGTCAGVCCPSGAGTTVPCWTRGRGAGALRCWAVGVEGQGGSGVLPQAVSSSAASVAGAAQRVIRGSGRESGVASARPRWNVCWVMVWAARESPGCGASRALCTWMLPARTRLSLSAYIPLQTCGGLGCRGDQRGMLLGAVASVGEGDAL